MANEVSMETSNSNQMNSQVQDNPEIASEQTPLIDKGDTQVRFRHLRYFRPSHLKSRYWWLVPVFIFFLCLVAVPNWVTQWTINNTCLEIVSVDINQATNQTFQVKIEAKVKTPINLPATLYPTTVAVLYKESILGYVPIPRIEVGKSSQPQNQVTLGGTFNITNPELVSEFGIQLFQQDKLEWVIDGPLTVSALGFTFNHLRLRQSMELSGMGGLNNITVLGFELPDNHPAGGVKILVHTLLQNPTSTSISVGSVEYGLDYEGLNLGIIEASNFQLVPGVNQLELFGRLLPHNNQTESSIVSQFVSRFLRGETTDVSIRGLGVTPKVTWLDQAIRSHAATIPFTNPASDFVKDIDILDLETKFKPASPYAPQIGSKIRSTIQAPFEFPYDILTVSENFDLYFKQTKMATMKVPSSKATLQVNGSHKAVLTQFNGVSLKVEEGSVSQKAFHSFLTEMVFSNSSTVQVFGSISASIKSALGILNLKEIPISKPMVFPGLNGMKDPPPGLDQLIVTGTRPGKVGFAATAHIANPSIFSGQLGDVKLKLQYMNQDVGEVTLLNFHMKANQSVSIQTTGTLMLPSCKISGCSANQDQARQSFLTQYISGTDQIKVSALGSGDSTGIASLQPALSKLNYTMAIPRPSTELYQGSKFRILKRAVELQLANPFIGVTVTILALHATAWHNHTTLGTIDIDFTTPLDIIRNPNGLDPIVLLPNSTTVTKPLPVKIKSMGLEIIKDALNGSLLLNLTISVTASLYPDLSHPLYLNFEQYNIPSEVHL